MSSIFLCFCTECWDVLRFRLWCVILHASGQLLVIFIRGCSACRGRVCRSGIRRLICCHGWRISPRRFRRTIQRTITTRHLLNQLSPIRLLASLAIIFLHPSSHQSTASLFHLSPHTCRPLSFWQQQPLPICLILLFLCHLSGNSKWVNSADWLCHAIGSAIVVHFVWGCDWWCWTAVWRVWSWSYGTISSPWGWRVRSLTSFLAIIQTVRIVRI